MGLETGSYLNDLVETNPIGSVDIKGEGDNHLRLIKSVVKNTFPGMTGRAWRKQSKAAGYNVVIGDATSFIQATAGITLTFDPAATLGNGFVVYVDASNGNVTLDPNLSELINGSTTLVVPTGWSAVIFCDGAAFYALFSPRPSGTTAESVLDSIRETLGVGPTDDVTFHDVTVTGALNAASALQWLCFQQSDQDLVFGAATDVEVFFAPQAFELVDAVAFVKTASSSGDVIFDINAEGSSRLSSKLTIDANGSISFRSASPVVITNPDIAKSARVSIDIDSAGTNPTGWGVMMQVRWKVPTLMFAFDSVTLTESIRILLNPERFTVFDAVTVTDAVAVVRV